MKITKLILSMLTISTLMNFTACKDDDDDDVEIDAFAKEIPVNFAGHTEAKFAYVADYLNNNGASATVSVVNDSTVSVKFSSTTWGDAEFSNVVVKKTSDGYTLSDTTGTFNMGMPGSEKKDYPAVLSGNVKSADDFAITITLQVMGGTTIKFLPGLVETESEISPNRGNSPSQQTLIEAVTGEYTDIYAGIVNAGTVTSAAVADQGTKVEITYSDGKFYLTTPELVYNGNTLPALTFPIEVASQKDAEGVYTLTQNSYEGSTTVNGAEKTFTITDFSGTIDNGNLTFTGSEKYGSMPFPLTMTYPYSE